MKKKAIRKGNRIMIRKVLRPGQLPCRNAGEKGFVISARYRPIIHVRLDSGTHGTVLESCLIPLKRPTVRSVSQKRRKGESGS